MMRNLIKDIRPPSHDSLISLRIKKRIMVDFRLFYSHFERIANSTNELTSELCYNASDQ